MSAENLSDKKVAILKAALELISEHGFHGTPMSLVAQKANVGVGTIYRYYASKEDLINALYTHIKARITEAMLAGYSEDLPIRARFIKINRNLVKYYINHPTELRFVEQYANSPFITDSSRQESLQMLETIAMFFQFAQQQQVIKAVPIEILSSLVYGGVVSLAKLYLADSKLLDDNQLELALDALWDAIKL